MRIFQLSCGNCKGTISVPLNDASVGTVCPSCGTVIQVEAFPALLEGTREGQRGKALLVAEESSCFYHPTKKAAIVCEGCGRFLCGLCDIPLAGQHLCPACIEAGMTKGKMKQLKTEVVNYDSIALAIAVVPLLFCWLSVLTAPVALIYAIKHWNSPLSIVPRTKWRLVAAIVVAGLEIVVAGFFLITMLGDVFAG